MREHPEGWWVEYFDVKEIIRDKEKAEAELERTNDLYIRYLAKCSNLKAELASIKQLTYCAYCGKEFLIDSDGSEISEHIKTCEDHPMREVEADLADCYNSSNVIIKKWGQDYIDLEAENIRLLAALREEESISYDLKTELKNVRDSERVYRQKMSSWIDRSKALKAELTDMTKARDRVCDQLTDIRERYDCLDANYKAMLTERNFYKDELDKSANRTAEVLNESDSLREALEKIRDHTYKYHNECMPYLLVKRIARDALKEG